MQPVELQNVVPASNDHPPGNPKATLLAATVRSSTYTVVRYYDIINQLKQYFDLHQGLRVD